MEFGNRFYKRSMTLTLVKMRYLRLQEILHIYKIHMEEVLES